MIRRRKLLASLVLLIALAGIVHRIGERGYLALRLGQRLAPRDAIGGKADPDAFVRGPFGQHAK